MFGLRRARRLAATAAAPLVSVHWGLAWWDVVAALAQAGLDAEAERAVSGCGPPFGIVPRYRVVHERCHAALAAARGQAPEALARLARADYLAREIGLPTEIAAILEEQRRLR